MQPPCIFGAMRFYAAFWLFIFLYQPIRAQVVYNTQLHIMPDGLLIGQTNVSIANHHLPKNQSICIEFWPFALESQNSVIAKQLLEDQQVDYHFAHPKERFQIIEFKIFDDQQRPLEFTRGRSAELLWLKPFANESQGDTTKISFLFQIKLPNAKWLGQGISDDGIFFQNLPPRLAFVDSSGFKPSVMTREGNRNRAAAKHHLSLKLPPQWMAFSDNPSQIENDLFSQFIKNDFTSLGSGLSLYYKSTNGSDLPFFISKNFHLTSFENSPHYAIWLGSQSPKQNLIDLTHSQVQKLQKWWHDQYGLTDTLSWKMVFLDDNLPETQSPGLLVLKSKQNITYSELEIARQYFSALLSEDALSQSNPWLSVGLAEFLAQSYVEETKPGASLSGPFENSLLAKLFDTDALPLGYQNQLLYLFLARQGLVQLANDSAEAYTRGTYLAQMRGLTALQLNYLHDYLGPAAFKRSLHQYLKGPKSEAAFKTSFQKGNRKSINWFFDGFQSSPTPLNQKLLNAEWCPSLFVVNSKSLGTQIPYPISAFRNDSLIMEEWFLPHAQKEGKNFYLDRYDRLVLANPFRYPELHGKNNIGRVNGILPLTKPIQFQPYTNFENPTKTQIYWLPSVAYNAYDQLLLGMSLYNTTLIPKTFEYRITPEYSTGTGKITWYASTVYNKAYFTGTIRRLRAGLFYRQYHYDQDLLYRRFSPGLTLFFRKPHPRDPHIRSLRFRNVFVERELESNENREVGFAGYSVFNIQYQSENTSILNPLTIKYDFQIGDLFSKLSAEFDQRIMLPNKRWLMVRAFGGWMPHNHNPLNVNLFDFGLSGTQDYLFDYNFIGRSEESGIWSRQYFTTDGGFRSSGGIFARNWMAALNISVPVYKFLGFYGDVGFADGLNRAYYSTGIRLALITDFLEIALPLSTDQIPEVWNESHYLMQGRFMMNLSLDAIINRLRRGYY